MLKKGVIMSISSSYAVVMEKGGQFHRIQLKEDMQVGQGIFFIDEDIITYTSPRICKPSTLVALAAAFLLVLLPIFYTIQVPVAVVSLDINPSIELLINKQGVVKKIIDKNQDSMKLELKGLKGQPLERALNTLSEELERKGFKSVEDFILVSYADLKGNSLDLGGLLSIYMEESFKNAHIVYLPSDKQVYTLSQKDAISLGRYSAGILLEEKSENVDFRNMDIPSLIQYIEEMDEESQTDDWDDERDDVEHDVEHDVEEDDVVDAMNNLNHLGNGASMNIKDKINNQNKDKDKDKEDDDKEDEIKDKDKDEEEDDDDKKDEIKDKDKEDDDKKDEIKDKDKDKDKEDDDKENEIKDKEDDEIGGNDKDKDKDNGNEEGDDEDDDNEEDD